jgi:probable phosphoglycerate mutase
MIYLIRHGQTDWNAERRLQGQKDIPLNDVGREQAARNGRELSRLLTNPESFNFVASPLGRTRETMEIVRHNMGLEPHVYSLDEKLLEISFGDWEGQTFKELSVDYHDLVEQRHASKWNFLQPNGESYQILCDRVGLWLNSLEQDTVAVCHGGVIRALLHLLQGTPKDEIVEMIVPQDHLYVWHGDYGEWV